MQVTTDAVINESPETGWSGEPSPVMFGRNPEGADADWRPRVLLANVSLAIGRDCCGCLLSDGCGLTPASESWSAGGVERWLDWSVCFFWEFDLCEQPTAMRKALTDFRKGLPSTAQYFGQKLYRFDACSKSSSRLRSFNCRAEIGTDDLINLLLSLLCHNSGILMIGCQKVWCAEGLSNKIPGRRRRFAVCRSREEIFWKRF